MAEIDPNFEPITRARSNTWPQRPKDPDDNNEVRTPNSEEGREGEVAVKDPLGLAKAKTSSRRNAWGNLSYADLITKAIQSSAEQRLTLSQIYDWMVQNVPYFKDKGDSNSSAGWKNSIRHNLSLHNRFMRIQNEGTGKSSWWVINPDAKPGKAPRRRATSMDTKAYEKKRGRAKKKVEQLRAQLEGGDGTPNSSLGGSASDLHLSDAFQLSPQDFRARTSSNASSIGGRLSPIHAGLEPDLHDNEVPPISPIPWSQDGVSAAYKSDNYIPENLTESLAEMFVGESLTAALSPDVNVPGESHMSGNLATPSPMQSQMSPNSGVGLNFSEGNGLLPAPPPYPTQRQSPNQRSPQNALMNNSLSPIGGGMSNQGLAMTSSMSSAMMNSSPLNTSGSRSAFMSPQHQMSGGDIIQNDTSIFQGQQDSGLLQQDPNLAGINSMNSMSMGSSSSAFQNNMGMRAMVPPAHQQANLYSPQQQQQQQQQRQVLMSQLNNSLLRQALTQKAAEQAAQQQQQQQQVLHQQQTIGGPVHTIYPPDIDFTEMDIKDLNCDVDQIINHELSFDGALDFSFDPTAAAQSQR